MQYVFVLSGNLRTALEGALRPVSVLERDDSTEMTLEIRDTAELYGVLARMERMGLSIESFGPVRRDRPDVADESPSRDDQ